MLFLAGALQPALPTALSGALAGTGVGQMWAGSAHPHSCARTCLARLDFVGCDCKKVWLYLERMVACRGGGGKRSPSTISAAASIQYLLSSRSALDSSPSLPVTTSPFLTDLVPYWLPARPTFLSATPSHSMAKPPQPAGPVHSALCPESGHGWSVRSGTLSTACWAHRMCEQRVRGKGG